MGIGRRRGEAYRQDIPRSLGRCLGGYLLPFTLPIFLCSMLSILCCPLGLGNGFEYQRPEVKQCTLPVGGPALVAQGSHLYITACRVARPSLVLQVVVCPI